MMKKLLLLTLVATSILLTGCAYLETIPANGSRTINSQTQCDTITLTMDLNRYKTKQAFFSDVGYSIGDYIKRKPYAQYVVFKGQLNGYDCLEMKIKADDALDFSEGKITEEQFASRTTISTYGKCSETGETKQSTPTPSVQATQKITSSGATQAYKEYIAAYNKLTQLMSEGKGDSEEGKTAYEEYKQAKEAYEAIAAK